MVYFLIIIIPLLSFMIFVLSRRSRDDFSSWRRFRAKGREAGFSFREIRRLRELAGMANVPEPLSVFQSRTAMDICIRSLVRTMRLSGEEEPANQEFLSRLYEYRKKIEIHSSTNKEEISSTRQIPEGQPLRILANGSGVFKSRLIKNTNQHLVIVRPFNPTAPAAFGWKGKELSVYFWHEEGAGYVFTCRVLDETFIDAAALAITHSDSLLRTRKRNSVRIQTHKSAFLYPIQDEADKGRFEVVPGRKCFIEDLSDMGCAVTLGGKAETGTRVKVQFVLDNIPLGISGTVRSVGYNEETGRSLVHIEADPMSLEAKNYILGEVFGMSSCGDDDFIRAEGV